MISLALVAVHIAKVHVLTAHDNDPTDGRVYSISGRVQDKGSGRIIFLGAGRGIKVYGRG